MRQRYAAYLEAVMEAGLDVPMGAFKVPAIERFGLQVADEVLAEADRCDALVCANDELAMSVMKALSRRGLRCPDDILITGFDDIMLARYTMPGLTSVRQPIQALASMLAQRLHERITTAEHRRVGRVALMAPTHFIREFKRVFGEPPYRYLQRRRVERAMFLLRHGTDTVTQICADVGFVSLGTFSRTFTVIVGESPMAYRNSAVPLRAPTSFAMRWTRLASFASPSGGPQG